MTRDDSRFKEFIASRYAQAMQTTQGDFRRKELIYLMESAFRTIQEQLQVAGSISLPKTVGCSQDGW